MESITLRAMGPTTTISLDLLIQAKNLNLRLFVPD